MRLLLLPLLICLFWVIGCGETEADISSPKTHTSGELTFNYPKNWKITQDSVMPGIQNLFVETPGDALVILQSYPRGVADDLATFAKSFSASASAEMPLGEVTHSRFRDILKDEGDERIIEDFEISVLGESIPHQRIFESQDVAERKVFLIFQVATEDLTKVEDGFELISTSLYGQKL